MEFSEQNMSSLAQSIEKYLLMLLNEANGSLRLQRSDLAEQFNCVPSQINYVLKTRFSIERGFLIESQRGGGGFIEIRQLNFNQSGEGFMYHVFEIIGNKMTQQQMVNLLKNLEDKRIVTKREKLILQALLNRQNLNIDLPYRDYLRAKLFKAALGAIMKSEDY